MGDQIVQKGTLAAYRRVIIDRNQTDIVLVPPPSGRPLVLLKIHTHYYVIPSARL